MGTPGATERLNRTFNSAAKAKDRVFTPTTQAITSSKTVVSNPP
jgi:hypothetical protein